jgi:hypothetical protein
MLPANLRLSQEERLLLLDTRFILTKNAVLQKVEILFGELSETFRSVVQQMDIETTAPFILTPKIARGENYEGLPWVMMDYPRLFTKTDTCAIRCFFWWGHYCTITLQLSGTYQQQYFQATKNFVQTIPQHNQNEWYLSIGANAWQHVISESDYTPIQQITQQYWEQERPCLKLTKKIPLEKWDDMKDFFEENFKQLLAILQPN